EDPGHIEGNIPFVYLKAFCKPEHFAKYLPEYKSLKELEAHYKKGGLGDGTVKKFLNSILQEELEPIRERRHYYENNLSLVYDMLQEGSKEARKVAIDTLKKVRQAVGVEYFEDSNLLKTYTDKYNK
ncbi:MAG: tryptophan--tRNA ligase, partial [Alphaproteobacteria bacterium]|nr:tryptophan--tRNA ligase [Alphaproteobacteria bacterium]